MKVSNKDSKSIAVIVADLTFVPTVAQMKTKASFNSNWAGLSTPTEGDVAQITGSASIQKWWAQPGFRDWFTGADQTTAQMAFLKSLALRTAEEILTDPDATAAARVNMVKLVLQYEGALEEKKMASSVQTVKKVSTQELIKRLESVKGTIDVESETNT